MIRSPTRFCTDEVIKYLIGKYCPRNNVAILDVGCGNGHYYEYFSSYSIKGSYLGVDIEEHESWQTREENDLQISFLPCDAQKLQHLNQKFDFIIAMQSLEHMKNDEKVVKGIHDIDGAE